MSASTSVTSAHACKQPKFKSALFKSLCQTRILLREQDVDAVSGNPRCYGNSVHVCFYVFLLWLIPCSLFRRFAPPDCKYLQRVAASLSSLSIIPRMTAWQYTRPLFSTLIFSLFLISHSAPFPVTSPPSISPSCHSVQSRLSFCHVSSCVHMCHFVPELVRLRQW